MALTNVVSSYERQRRLASLIEQTGRLSVASICEQFGISEATARRDLDILSDQGLIQRVHGGAIALQKAPPELPVLDRQMVQFDEKHRIGQAAAALIPNSGSVFLGSGTTVLEVAHCLRQRSNLNLTIITNSLSVINTFADLPSTNLIAIGGIFRPSELSFIGHLAEEMLAEIHVDTVCIGARAINLQHGLTNDYLAETMTDRAILKISQKVILVADHTKFGSVSTAFLAPVEDIHGVVTDDKTDMEYIKLLREKGIEVIVT